VLTGSGRTSGLITVLLNTDYFRGSSRAILAREQGEITVPMPERESYPDDHKRADSVPDEK
jgi:hypothetical protein